MVYGFGALGLAWPATRAFFLVFTPYTLLLGGIHLLYCEENRSPRFWWSMTGVWLAGFLVEWAGVATGAIFGAYSYGHVLGAKLAGVPLVIGINWTILIYAAAYLAQQSGVSAWLRPVVGATVVTFTDVFIEPVAVFFEFWTWELPPFDALFVAPWRNYAAWWLFSFAVLWGFEALRFKAQNQVILRYWLFQLGFFILLNILV